MRFFRGRYDRRGFILESRCMYREREMQVKAASVKWIRSEEKKKMLMSYGLGILRRWCVLSRVPAPPHKLMLSRGDYTGLSSVRWHCGMMKFDVFLSVDWLGIFKASWLT